jgi:hypothetical protein
MAAAAPQRARRVAAYTPGEGGGTFPLLNGVIALGKNLLIPPFGVLAADIAGPDSVHLLKLVRFRDLGTGYLSQKISPRYVLPSPGSKRPYMRRMCATNPYRRRLAHFVATGGGYIE